MSLIIKNLNKTYTKEIPIWLMRQAGRYLPEYRKVRRKFNSFLDLCNDLDAIIEVTMQPMVRYNFDAAIIFSDILLIPKSLGAEVDFIEGEGPLLEGIHNEKDVFKYKQDIDFELLDIVYSSIKEVKKELAQYKTPLIGFAGAPWTLACYMIEGKITKDLKKARLFASKYKSSMDTLISTLTNAVIQHLIRQIEAGAEVIQIFDSHAGKADKMIQYKYCIVSIKNIVEEIKALYPKTPIILFSKGIGSNILHVKDIKGLNCVSLDQSADLERVKNLLPNKVCIQGNLNPMSLVTGGSVLKEGIKRILSAKTKERGFIFNLGHGVLPQTPPDNVKTLVDIIRENT